MKTREVFLCCAWLLACGDDGSVAGLCDEVANECVAIGAGATAGEELQAALQGEPADRTIVLSEGRFDLETGVSGVNLRGVTIRGQGPDLTVLSFANQAVGSGNAGLLIQSSENITIEALAVEDTQGDGVRVEDSRAVIMRNLRAEWTNGPDTNNGRYGIYPVRCDGVLVDNVVARGASDAGIYVGESRSVVVRGSRAEENVAGIQIENTFDSDVHDNEARNNTAGLMVFDLPGKLEQKNGGRHRIHDNLMEQNNTPNFGAEGAIVSELPSGLGGMVMATREVELFGNTFRDNDTGSLGIVSFFISGRDPSDDPDYVPYPFAVYAHDNVFDGGGTRPDSSSLAGMALIILGGIPVPDIVFDGILAPEPDPSAPDPETNPHFICLKDNTDEDGAIEFRELDGDAVDFDDPNTVLDAMPSDDITPYECEGQAQPPVAPLEG